MLIRIGFTCFVLFFFINASVWAADIDRIAKDLQVTYDVVRNGVLTPYATVTYFANVTLENVGKEAIPSSGWSIYFCHHTLIQPVYYNATINQYIGGGLILSGNITLSHVKGCMFKFDPYNGDNPAFITLPLNPGELRNISFLASNWAVSRYDIFPNWYLGNGTHTRIIENTAEENSSFVAPLQSFVQFMRGIPNDVMGIPTSPYDRYRGYNFTDLETVKHSILPTPKQMKMGTGSVKIDNKWTVDIDKEKRLVPVAKYLQKSIKGTKIRNRRPTSNKVIHLLVVKKPVGNPEAYRIDIKTKPDRIEIRGNSISGVVNGIHSLFSLLAFGGTIPAMTIKDEPRFGYRGIQVDLVRNFFPKSTIMKLLDVMALFKLNKLQLNLADDEGWRLDIEGLPELAKIGGKRCHDVNEETCLFSQLGSDPDGTGVGSGYYTKKDYIDILRAARERNIEIIPSFNMGGRARAAIVAMEAYSKRSKTNNFRLHDRNTDNIYLTDTLFADSAINPCMPSTFTFFDYVLKKVKDYHRIARNPLRVINIGGDDSPAAAWINSTFCQNLNFEGPDVFMRIKVNYTTRIAQIAAKHGLSLSGFEEFFVAWPTTDPRGGPLVPFDKKRFPRNIQMAAITRNSQNDVFIQRATAFANNGYKVILSQSDFLSLDHASEADPNSLGDYWAIRYIDPLRVFTYLPEHRCCNLIPDEFTFGKMPFAPYGCIDDSNCLELRYPKNITGMQAQVWTTKIRTEDQLFKLLLPRLIIFAERAWYRAPWENSFQVRKDVNKDFPVPDYAARDADWVRVASIIGHREFKRLEAYGVNAQIPAPGARNMTYIDDKNVTKNVLHTDVTYPGLVPQVRGGQNKWADIKPATDITNLNMNTVIYRTRNSAGTRNSKEDQFVLQKQRNVLERLVDAGLISPPAGMGIPPGFTTTTAAPNATAPLNSKLSSKSSGQTPSRKSSKVSSKSGNGKPAASKVKSSNNTKSL